MKKTAQFIEEQKSLHDVAKDKTRKRKSYTPPAKSLANLKPVQKGEIRNPAGHNGWTKGTDVAAVLARAVIEGNYEEAAEGLGAQIRKGNAYTFTQLADRGYGKLKESKEVKYINGDVADADLNERIAQLERDLGLARAIDEAGRVGIAQAGAGETNSQPQDTSVLP